MSSNVKCNNKYRNKNANVKMVAQRYTNPNLSCSVHNVFFIVYQSVEHYFNYIIDETTKTEDNPLNSKLNFLVKRLAYHEHPHVRCSHFRHVMFD